MKVVENKQAKKSPAKIGGDEGTFSFVLERNPDTQYDLPMIQDLPASQVRKLSKAQGEASVDVIFDLFDSLCPGLTDIATQREIGLIMQAWSDASNTSVGE